MRAGKRALALALVCALVLGAPALAAEGDLFPAVRDYAAAGYGDVAESDWFFDAARACYETGLITGTDQGFSPTATVTVGQCIAIAARIRAALTGRPIPSPTPVAGEQVAWYQCYVDYFRSAETSGVALDATGAALLDRPEAQSTRLQALYLLDLALQGQDALPAINTITALPDTEEGFVLAFYNAGILTGVDEYGTFYAGGVLTRAEMAAMVARIVRPALRQQFVPKVKTVPTYEEELSQTMAFSLNGFSVTLGQFVKWLNRTVYQVDANQLTATGRRLDWTGETDYGVGDLGAYFVALTLQQMERQLVQEVAAQQYGCTVDTLAATLTPAASAEQLRAYADGADLLAAKHILISSRDESTDAVALQTANAVLDGLDQNPTETQFNNLLYLYGEDPGMTSYPEGYLFSAGEMVSEFEAAVRALEVGGYSDQPVKSSYGYHIIWRLDPATLSETKTRYQQAVLDALTDVWVEQATVTVNDAMLDELNVKGCYDAYLAQMIQQAAQGE